MNDRDPLTPDRVGLADLPQGKGTNRVQPRTIGDSQGPGDMDVDQLRARIRQAAARRCADQRTCATAFSHESNGETPAETVLAGVTNGPAQPEAWLAIVAALQHAEQHSNIGRDLPDFTRFPRPLRQVARLVAWAILYLSRFLTQRQSDCNHAMLRALHQLSDSLCQRVSELERQLAQINKDFLGQASCPKQSLPGKAPHTSKARI